MSDITEISASSFNDEVMKVDEPVVVEFFSHSCPHCIKFNPVCEKLAEVLDDEVRFVRIDVLLSDENRTLAHSRGVRTVPTLEVFYRGELSAASWDTIT